MEIDLESAFIWTIIKWQYYAKTGNTIAQAKEEYPFLDELIGACGLCSFAAQFAEPPEKCRFCPLKKTSMCQVILPLWFRADTKKERKKIAKFKLWIIKAVAEATLGGR